MPQSRDGSPERLAKRLCWLVARRADARVARRLCRTPVGEGVYWLDAGAGLEEGFPCLPAFGELAGLEQLRGAALDRVMGPCGSSGLLDGLKALCGLERSKALSARLLSDEALMRLGGQCAAGSPGGCRRGRTTRQGERTPGPICPDTLANNIVQGHRCDLEAMGNGGIRALATAGVLGKRVAGSAEGPDRETTERDQGGGQGTCTRRLEDTRGKVHVLEVPVSGWKALRLIEAVPKMPLAVKEVQRQEHEARWTRRRGEPGPGHRGWRCVPGAGGLCSGLLGGHCPVKDGPPGIGTLPEILARYRPHRSWVNLLLEAQGVLGKEWPKPWGRRVVTRATRIMKDGTSSGG